MKIQFFFRLVLVVLVSSSVLIRAESDSNTSGSGETQDGIPNTNKTNYDTEEEVLVLNDNNIEETLKIFPYLLIEFYVPWCGHCQKLQPEYNAAAAKLKSQHSIIRLAKINCDSQRQAAQKFKIDGYPTIKFFTNGEEKPFQGSRSVVGILKFLKSNVPKIAYGGVPEIPGSSGGYQEEENVIILNSENVEQALKEFKYLIIEFYVPWCGHCERLQPEYSKAAAVLKEQKSTIRLAKVDGDAERELLQKFKVEGFPTLKFFVDGKESPYRGGRSEEGIIKWLKQTVPHNVFDGNIQLGTESSVNQDIGGYREESDVFVLTDENIRKSLTDFKYLLIEFYAPWCGHCQKLQPEYNSAATKLKQSNALVKLAKLDCNAYGLVAQEFGIEGYPTVKFFVNGNERSFNGGRSEASILQFLRQALPIEALGELAKGMNSNGSYSEEENILILTNNNIQNAINEFEYLLVQFYASWCGHCKNFQPEYEKAAAALKKHKANVKLAKINGDMERGASINFGIQSFPTLKFFSNGDVKDYKESRTHDEILKFIHQNVPENQLGTLNEESREEKNENVLLLTNQNIDKALEEHKYLLIEFYAPWCGHCQRLQPEYNKAAETLKKMNSLVKLAKVNCNKEKELAVSFNIRDYPTLKFFVSGKEQPYKGGISETTIMKFLKASVPAEDFGSGAITDQYFKELLMDSLLTEENVVVLSKENIEEAIKTYRFIVIDFYAKWCDHCKKLEPEYAKAARKLREINSSVVLAKFNVDFAEDLAIKFGVKGLPSIKFFAYGEEKPYEGGRKANKILSWLERTVPINVFNGLYQSQAEASKERNVAQNSAGSQKGENKISTEL